MKGENRKDDCLPKLTSALKIRGKRKSLLMSILHVSTRFHLPFSLPGLPACGSKAGTWREVTCLFWEDPFAGTQ